MDRTYLVSYRSTGATQISVTRCITSPRYGTTFASIPKMICLKRGWSEEDLEIVSAQLLESKETEQI